MPKIDTMVLEEPQRACTPFVLSTSTASAELAVVVSTGFSQHERNIHVRLLRLTTHIPPSGIIVGEQSCLLRESPVRL